MKKIIRDTIYTYIETEEEIKDIIDSESFQRLKYIKQLTIQHLYPSANHTRFEHSLGVMHLALLVFERIRGTLQNKQMNNSSDDIDFLKDHLLYASLLHDVGHAPFSHVGENFFSRKNILSEIEKEMELIKDKFNFSIEFLEDEEIVPHELMSCYVIIRKFLDKLVPCYYKSEKEKNITFDLEFIFRIICGRRYEYSRDLDPVTVSIRNTVISIVNSETVDVDKIDYLLRDNKMVGYIGPQLDVNRLIMSVTVNEPDGLIFSSMGISALQGLIDCRDILYLWVFNHHTVVYTDYLYQKCFVRFCKLNKSNSNLEDSISLSSLFSCKAIVDDCVSDIDALLAIKKVYKSVKDKTISSACTAGLVKQLVDRKFLKPIWKTLNQYNNFLLECGYKTDEQKIVTEYISNWRNRMKLVYEIAKKLKIERGNLFIVERENKFCEKILDNLAVKIDNKEKLIKDLLPIKKHEEKYQKTAFYVYCEGGIKDEVRAELKIKLKEIRGHDQQMYLDL